MDYKLYKNSGALQEAMGSAGPQHQQQAPPPALRMRMAPASFSADPDQSVVLPANVDQATGRHLQRMPEPPRPPPHQAHDRTARIGRRGILYTTIEEGQRALLVKKDGTMEVLVGPRRVFTWSARILPMTHYVAHPGEFLILRFRDGKQEHLRGPAHVWFDPREHLSVEKEDLLQIASKEAVVVYSQAKPGEVSRRIEYGPAGFVPAPGEWLHTFSWHGSAGGEGGFKTIPNGLVFQKLWLMPDQMYHDVPDVRTADDAVLTIRLMIFFELVDIERMLATSHDPIGDFVNAATSDLVEFVGKHDFESFKKNTDKLNDLGSYRQLTVRAEQCGYRIGKVVYRGYGAPEALQEMHNQAIESRTRLQLERATEQQAQELEDFRLERQLERTKKQRDDDDARLSQELGLSKKREEAALEGELHRRTFQREQERLDAEERTRQRRIAAETHQKELDSLRGLGVDLTRYLTQGRADQVLEIRGDHAAHLHLDAPRPGQTREPNR